MLDSHTSNEKVLVKTKLKIFFKVLDSCEYYLKYVFILNIGI